MTVMEMITSNRGQDPDRLLLGSTIQLSEKLPGLRRILSSKQLFHLIEKQHQGPPIQAVPRDLPQKIRQGVWTLIELLDKLIRPQSCTGHQASKGNEEGAPGILSLTGDDSDTLARLTTWQPSLDQLGVDPRVDE